VAVAPAHDIDALISKLGTMQSSVAEAIAAGDDEEAEAEAAEGPAEITDLRASAQDGPVIKLVNSILGQAVAEGASDIHFEPDDTEMRIRFRIDGVLQETARVPKRMVAGVVSRIKIMSELDIAEKRVPQDGRVGVVVDDRRCASRRSRRRPGREPRSGSSTRPPPCAPSTTSAWRATSASASRRRSGSRMGLCW
jgi:type IV pilus assembly protein PilB